MFTPQGAQAVAWFLMSRAGSYLGFLLPLTILAAASPVYAVGSDAMMADLLPPGKRRYKARRTLLISSWDSGKTLWTLLACMAEESSSQASLTQDTTSHTLRMPC